MIETNENNPSKKALFIKWIKRLGIWGFLFFLLKGLVWLAFGYWVLK